MPIDQITVADLAAMLGRDAEGPLLEFKEDIPLHTQSRKEQLSRGEKSPHDQWWAGKAMAPHGRDELLAEVVAFANARGGRLIVGMAEEAGTTVAAAIAPIPRIRELEARFIDCLLSSVEPRLPQFRVRGVEVDGNGGGVLVVDVQPSRLGPHRVAGTLAVTVRRADKCMPMTMGEVHGMVLRNAGRFDEVRSMLDRRLGALEESLLEFLESRVGPNFVGARDGRIRAWLTQENKGAIAFRVVVCAHDDLGLSRLATFDPHPRSAMCG